MKLILNEQEIVDGICVYMSEHFSEDLENINVTALNYNKDEGFTASANCFSSYDYGLTEEEICDGIIDFLVEFHSFNPDALNDVSLNFDKKKGFLAEILVNE